MSDAISDSFPVDISDTVLDHFQLHHSPSVEDCSQECFLVPCLDHVEHPFNTIELGGIGYVEDCFYA